jgi:hypothetical protein
MQIVLYISAVFIVLAKRVSVPEFKVYICIWNYKWPWFRNLSWCGCYSRRGYRVSVLDDGLFGTRLFAYSFYRCRLVCMNNE